MDLTIVMAFWNRKQQLLNTLRSIEQYGHDVKIIIVDDASTDNQDIANLNSTDKIKVVTLKDKWWINPCIAFNTGLIMADTDIVIIQNPECIHVGDVIGHTLANIKEGTYLNYSALAINDQLTGRISNGEDVKEVIAPYMKSAIWIENWDGNGWYNHPLYRAVMLHFCSAIMRSDLYSLGGFDERYANGSAFDDNEFLCRIMKKGMNIKMIEDPFVVHQAHYPFYCGDVMTLMNINNDRFIQTQASHEYDVKPYNNIYK
jgi:glycosyltransferase involved in cell wall biosynthesis